MTRIEILPWRIETAGPVTDFTESVFAVGNGWLGARGFSTQAPKARPQDHALFRAGFFEAVKPGITDMVQLPDALGLRVKGYTPMEARQSLDLRRGILTHAWETDGLAVATERMVSMDDRQLICLRMTLRAQEAKAVTVEAILDEHVANLPVHDDQMVEETETVRLLETVSHTENALEMRALHSGRRLRIEQRLLVNGEPRKGNQVELTVPPGESVTVEKRVRVLLDSEAPNADAADPWQRHEAAWDALWRDCDIRLDADEEIQGALRWNIFQLLCNNAAGNAAVSIGARGLTHGRYKGNAFWDTDIFMLPFYCWTRPDAAKALMQFRVDHLPEARSLAAKQNLSGARFPWMCAVDGVEQCESWDIGLCEVHITADVAYALERVHQITGKSLTEGERELLAETARYWLSRFTWEPGERRYSSFFVKGPDEYCGAAVNNTYTNYMARYNVRLALDLAGDKLDKAEREELKFFADHIALLYDESLSLFKQDELFDRLEPLPGSHTGGEPLYRRICFDRMQRYRALKQADLVQLMVLLPEDFTPEQKRAVWDAYEPLTVHDSSLSYGVHAHLAFQLGLMEESWNYFTRSLLLDLRNELNNTGREGVHMASLGATWQALVFGALGLWAQDGRVSLKPNLPKQIRSVSMRVWQNGVRYRVYADHGHTEITRED